jgi:hypothetical protein
MNCQHFLRLDASGASFIHFLGLMGAREDLELQQDVADGRKMRQFCAKLILMVGHQQNYQSPKLYNGKTGIILQKEEIICFTYTLIQTRRAFPVITRCYYILRDCDFTQFHLGFHLVIDFHRCNI